MPLHARRYEAFEGQVTFVCIGYKTRKYQSAFDELVKVFPEVVEQRGDGKLYMADSARARQVAEFTYRFGPTVEVEFALTGESPADLHNFKHYWQSLGSKDYRAALLDYLNLISAEVAQVWGEAVEATRDPIPAANGAADEGESVEKKSAV